jgi:FADH2 O2-dependent halogenase
MWVLRFNNGITSAGFALTESGSAGVGLPDAPRAWREMMRRYPSIGAQFAGAAPHGPLMQAAPIWFRSTRVVGPSWALLPSAAGVVDPLLSTGFPLTLLGVERMARWLEGGADPAALARYQSTTLAELDLTARLVAALYANLHRFEIFTALTMLYFAAASFSETVRRLGRNEMAEGFLLRERPNMVTVINALADASRAPEIDGGSFARAVGQAIERFNVAGLCDDSKHNWYPASAADLFAASTKLGATRQEIAAMLERVGFKD